MACSKVEMVFREGIKKLCFIQLLKRIRDFNLSPFRKIEPDQVKSLCATYGEKNVSELGFEPVSQKFYGAMRACLKKC